MLVNSLVIVRRAFRFNAEARSAYTRFAVSNEALWSGNFRELSASITRMATLSDGGRITEPLVRQEITRLRAAWNRETSDDLARIPGVELGKIDLFDRMQLQAVLDVCRKSRSMADAGRKLFAASRAEKARPNDSDRLRKYLARFGLDWPVSDT